MAFIFGGESRLAGGTFRERVTSGRDDAGPTKTRWAMMPGHLARKETRGTQTVQQQALFASIGWEVALEDYLFFKRSQGRKESTLTDIRQKVGQFFRTYPKA